MMSHLLSSILDILGHQFISFGVEGCCEKNHLMPALVHMFECDTAVAVRFQCEGVFVCLQGDVIKFTHVVP